MENHEAKVIGIGSRKVEVVNEEFLKAKAEEFTKNFQPPSTVHNGERVRLVPPPEGLTEEQIINMRTYARKLMVKHPDWKLSRIQRKTAEYFKIKFNDAQPGQQDSEG